jgi:hypothetical protein
VGWSRLVGGDIVLVGKVVSFLGLCMFSMGSRFCVFWLDVLYEWWGVLRQYYCSNGGLATSIRSFYFQWLWL